MSDVVVRRSVSGQHREVLRDGVTIGWVKKDHTIKAPIWDAYDEDRKWLRGFEFMEEAVQHLRIRSFRESADV